jgi:shikimate kinase
MNIYLIGYRCTGKSTVGEQLARQLSYPFLDLDQELVRSQGKTICQIVYETGWPGFRQAEANLVQKVSRTDGSVIATGGGAVLDPENVKVMRGSGQLIWLRATIDTIRRRMQHDDQTEASRPSLTSQSALDEIETTLAEREPVYRAAMHMSIDTDNASVDKICDQIAAYLKRLPAFRSAR